MSLDPFVVLEGGVVHNDPSVPVFDLDVLSDSDLEDIVALYTSVLDLAVGFYSLDTDATVLPETLRPVLREVEDAIAELIGEPDTSIVRMSRKNTYLREEFTEYAATIGPLRAQILARSALEIIGIHISDEVHLTYVAPRSGEVNPSQLEYAVKQYNAATGEFRGYESIEDQLPWV